MWAVPTKAEGVLGGTMAADTGARLNAADLAGGIEESECCH